MTARIDKIPLRTLEAELFRVIGHPGRIRILEQLSESERSVGELQALVGLESSHLSHQLGVLRRANLVVARKEGNQVFYSVRSELMVGVLAAAKQLLISTLTDTQNLLAELSDELDP